MEEAGTLEPSAMERVLRHDRRIAIVTLLVVTAIAWQYTVLGVGMGMSAFEMTEAPWRGVFTPPTEIHMDMPMGITAGSFDYYLALLAMWWLMMIAMMLPSATPTILLAAALNRRSSAASPPYGSAAFFTAGYLAAWLFFSVVAVIAQAQMARAGLLTGMMQSSSILITAGILVAAGLWQLSPIKQACLRHCRSPVDYLIRHRRPGNGGAFIMGLGHGSYCLGCCWFLMALLFAGGIMNLYWIIGLALFVLAEKLLERGVMFGRITGILLVLAGVVVAVSTLLQS